MIIGIGGECRRGELAKLSVKDVVDNGNYLDVLINDTKTNEPRDFAITERGLKYNLLAIVRKYMAMRKSHTPHERFFVSLRNGQCSTQPVGINTVDMIPTRIATFRGLEGPALYTGHCFRRSSATLLADSGADLYVIKKHGGWKSDSVAEGYVQSSITSKLKIAEKILGQSSTAKKDTIGASVERHFSVATDISAQNIAVNNSTSNVDAGASNSTDNSLDPVPNNTGSGNTSEIHDDFFTECLDETNASHAMSARELKEVTASSNIFNTSSQSVTILKNPVAAPEPPSMRSITRSAFSNCNF